MQKANISLGRPGTCINTEVTVIKETLGGGKFKMTYYSSGWGRPMTQGEFSSMVIKERLEVHPKKPKFKNIED